MFECTWFGSGLCKPQSRTLTHLPPLPTTWPHELFSQ